MQNKKMSLVLVGLGVVAMLAMGVVSGCATAKSKSSCKKTKTMCAKCVTCGAPCAKSEKETCVCPACAK